MADDVQFNITLPEDLARMVQGKIESGEFTDASDVVVEGLRTLRDHGLPLEDWLRQEAALGYLDYKRDATTGLTPEEARAALVDHIAAHRAR